MPTHGTAGIVIATIVSLAAAGSATAQSAWYHDELPPELQRLMRQAHDYRHNSNNNVFRSSRHFSPDRNPFRASRHYLQKLAAAHEARPVRTIVQFDERVDDGPRIHREFSFAHHLARYYDDAAPHRSFIGYPLVGPAGSVLLDPVEHPRAHEAARSAFAPAAAPARPTQQAAIKRVVLPDGRVKTIIYSVPIDPLERAAGEAVAAGGDDAPASRGPSSDAAPARDAANRRSESDDPRTTKRDGGAPRVEPETAASMR